MLAEYFEIITDPAHGLAEFTYSIFIDLVIFGLLWTTVWTKWLKPKLKREVHNEIDRSHGYVHNEGESIEEAFDRTGYIGRPSGSNVSVFNVYTATEPASNGDRTSATV